jgi:endonuclease/exonuclease/phosphatase family metal-dependent hydrolase
MIKYLVFFLIPIVLFAEQFKVATYNVENLFDAKKSGYEYKEYIPNTKSGWNEKMFSIKVKNIARVIKDIDADIISLQEIENKEVLKRLNLALGKKKYPYMYSSFKTEGLDVVLLSRYPIKEHNSYNVMNRFRPIHKVVVDVKGFNVTVFINHWPSYRHSLKTRMKFAEKLKELYIKEKNYILLGDFNSPLKEDEKGWGKEIKFVSNDNFNLWYDVPYNQRYSYKFFKLKNAIDHIVVSKSLYERYKSSSFEVHKFDYIVDKYGNAKRWKISNKGRGKHLGVGYSDHFAISAIFDTKKQNKSAPKEITIKELKKKNGRVNYLLKDVMVIKSSKYGITIEDKSRDNIFVFRPDVKLNEGEIYSLVVKEIGTYKGKKEITLLDFNYFLDKMGD